MAVVVAAAVLALAHLVRHRDPSNRSAPAPRDEAEPETCRNLAGRYRSALTDLAGCRSDDECAIEARDRWWFSLDRCFRTFNRSRSRAAVDALADRWLELGCATDTEVCPPPGRAICEASRCVMRPPEGVPRSWRRHVLARTVSFHLPPELTRAEARGIDSAARRYEGDGLELHVDYGDSIRRSADDDLTDRLPPLVRPPDERTVLVDGRQGRYVRYEPQRVDGAGGGPTPVLRQGRLLYLHDAPTRCLDRAPCLGAVHPALEIRIECADAEGCTIADTLLRSIRFW